MLAAVRKAEYLLLMGDTEVWEHWERVPAVGDNLTEFGYPEWYVFQRVESRGRIALDCRPETSRPPAVEAIGWPDDDDELRWAK